jgi:hypothetical protein
MEKIFAFLAKITDKVYIPCAIPADKQSHAIYGAFTAVVWHFVMGYWSIAIVAVIAALKEWYDSKHPDIHTADIWDFNATVIGGVIGSLFFLI